MKHFKNRIKLAGVPEIGLHDMRHTAATLFLAGGEHPKVVQVILGRWKIATTMDLYSHVSMSMRKQAAQKMDSLLGTPAKAK